jgi:hypothetical protein
MPSRLLVTAETAHLPIDKANCDLCLYLEQVVAKCSEVAGWSGWFESSWLWAGSSTGLDP